MVSFARVERCVPPLRPLRYAVLVDPPPAALPPVAVLQAAAAPAPLSLCDAVLASCRVDEVGSCLVLYGPMKLGVTPMGFILELGSQRDFGIDQTR